MEEMRNNENVVENQNYEQGTDWYADARDAIQDDSSAAMGLPVIALIAAGTAAAIGCGVLIKKCGGRINNAMAKHLAKHGYTVTEPEEEVYEGEVVDDDE